MREPTRHHACHWVAGVLGHGLAVLSRGVAALRPAAKPLHPHGEVLSARLHRVGAYPATGIPWLDGSGTDEVLVRMSRAVGLPQRFPDIFGLALRIPVGERHADLLFASTGLGRIGRFVLRPSRSALGRPMTTLLPYRTDQGPLLLAAVPASADTFDISCACGSGAWRRVGTLQLMGPGADALISFDPLLNTVPGLENYPFVRALREPAYRTARLSPR